MTEHREVAAEAVRKALHAALVEQRDELSQELAGPSKVAQQRVNHHADVRELHRADEQIDADRRLERLLETCSSRLGRSLVRVEQRLRAQQEDLVADVPFAEECARPLEDRSGLTRVSDLAQRDRPVSEEVRAVQMLPRRYLHRRVVEASLSGRRVSLGEGDRGSNEHPRRGRLHQHARLLEALRFVVDDPPRRLRVDRARGVAGPCPPAAQDCVEQRPGIPLEVVLEVADQGFQLIHAHVCHPGGDQQKRCEPPYQSVLAPPTRALVGAPVCLVRRARLAGAPEQEGTRHLAEDQPELVTGFVQHAEGGVEPPVLALGLGHVRARDDPEDRRDGAIGLVAVRELLQPRAERRLAALRQ